MYYEDENINENTFGDIKDELKWQLLKRNPPQSAREIGWQDGFENLRIMAGTPLRRNNLKRDGKIAGGTLLALGGAALGIKALAARKRKKKWLANGCDSIESLSERTLCKNYLAQVKLKREK